MKLVYSNLAPVLLFLLQWMDCSCTCLLPSYFNFFHITVYKVCFSIFRLLISSHSTNLRWYCYIWYVEIKIVMFFRLSPMGRRRFLLMLGKQALENSMVHTIFGLTLWYFLFIVRLHILSLEFFPNYNRICMDYGHLFLWHTPICSCSITISTAPTW